MQTKVTRWGNSLGIRILQWMAEQLKITEGIEVDIGLKNNSIVINKPKLSLQEMLDNISESNLHGEFDSGMPVGREEW